MKEFVLTVHFMDDAPERQYRLEKETDWSVFQESLLEVKDRAGIKAYFPVGSVWFEIS